MATASVSGSSHLGLSGNQKQWLVAGIALNKILIPQIRTFVEQGINTEYNKLKTSHNIHVQSTSGRLQQWPARKLLKYENINRNDVHPRLPGGRFNYSLFDCQVTSHVDFARLYVEKYMAHFSAFDDHCDASAVLALLGGVPVFSAGVQTAAGDVRMGRNDWAHCVFSRWDQVKFQQSFIEMEHLVRVMALPSADEGKLLGELKDWETKGTHLCMNSPVDPALLQLVQQELKSLQDAVENMSVEFEEEKRKVQHELENVAATLEEMKERMQRLETGHQNLENCTEVLKGRISDFQDDVNQRMEILESSQQNTESRTVLVEDKVYHLQEQMEDLTNPKESILAMPIQDSSMPAVFPEKLVELIKRDYEGAALCPFPWCEDELQMELSNIFTRLKIVNKKKERSRLTDDTINMTDVFKRHEECRNPRVVLIEGQPGMGKTTYCQKLAYDWSVGGIPADASFPKVEMLLLLKCRDMKTANIEEAIDDQLLPQDADKIEKKDFFHFIRSNQARILLVLDGLDELRSDLFQGFLPLIKGKVFSNTYLMLTARHETGKKLRRYCDTLLEIVGYTDADADSYISKYFSNHEDPSLGNKVIDKLKRDKELRELTTNPLNTALLCLLCEDTKGVFPTNRTKLYNELVSCALKRYFAKKGTPLDARDPVETFSVQLNELGRVALKALKEDRMFFNEDEMNCQSIDFLRLCFLSQEASVSKLKPMPCYAFVHKSFQEYFAAYHLAIQLLTSDEEQAHALLPQLSPAFKYWQVWKFLLTMVASKSDDAASVVISGLCTAFSHRGTVEDDEQDSDSDDDFDYGVHDDYDFDVCSDTLDEFPFFFLFTESEGWLINVLNSVFELILACADGQKELIDCQKKMVQALAARFPIRRLCTVECPARILFEYLKSDHNLTHLRWDDRLDQPALTAIEHILQSNCTLEYLDLGSVGRDKCLGSAGTSALARAINANRTLKYLNLRSNFIGDRGVSGLSQVLRSNHTLTHLDLQFNWIYSSGATELSQALESNRSLTHLNLQANLINNSGAEDLARALQSSCTLMYLDLSDNRIGDPGAVALAKALETNRTLTYLDLGRGMDLDGPLSLMMGRDVKAFMIGDLGGAAIAQALRSNCVLTRLNLQNNRISNPGATALGQALPSNCTLAHLCLRGNRIQDAGAAHLVHAIQVNRGLVNLDLRCNNFDLMFGGGCEATGAAISQALQSNSVLTHLDLRGNFAGCQVATALAESLWSNCTLTRVDLSYNMIKSFGAVALAKALQLNRTLSHLDLRGNHIGDLGAIEFVEALQSNNTLILLDLRYNRIGESGMRKLHGFLVAQTSRSTRTLLYHWSRDSNP